MATEIPEVVGTLCVRTWAADGFPSPPVCEDCDCDLTGLPVIETRVGWYCETCAPNNTGGGESSYREDFYADL